MKQNGTTKSRYTVKAIEDPSTINSIRKKLRSNPRNLLLFDMATQTGIHMQDILNMKVKDLTGLQINGRISSKNFKGNKSTTPVMTKTLYESFQKFIDLNDPQADEYLFKSQKGTAPLRLSTVSQMIRGWLESVGLNGHGGAKALRKTWKYFIKTDRISNSAKPKNDLTEITLEPVQSKTLQEKVYSQIYNAILTGRIKPGQKIVISQWAEKLNVSPAPVREALRSLEAMSMITPPQKKGCLVKELSKENLEEISQIRLLLELKASEQAVNLCSNKLIKQLEMLNRHYIESVEQNDVDKILSYNKNFHFALYEEAQMPILLEMIQNLWNRMSPYLHILFRTVDTYNITDSTSYHKYIIESLRRRDKLKLREVLKKDLDVGRISLLNYFEKATESFQ